MSRWTSIAGLSFVLAACDGGASSDRSESAGAGSADPPPHVVIVLVDTLRADHTSVGGYARDTTPGLQEIAAAGTLYRSHFVNAPWTKPSVASLWTGLLPPAHGAQWGDFNRAASGSPVDVLADGFETLPEILSKRGFSTHAFMTNTTLTPNLGYAQGFDEFVMLAPTLDGDEEAIAKTKATLDEATGPAFIWCHLMAPHNYDTPPGPRKFKTRGRTPITVEQPNGQNMAKMFGLRTREKALDVYDETVLFADAQVLDLFEHLRANHPNTLFVVTSDHGEELGEHGGWLHARTLYNEILHVPLLLWGPRVPAGRVVDELTSGTDLVPTVLDFLDLPSAPDLQGRSLFGDGASTVYAEKRNALAAKRALVTPTGKWIETKPQVAGRAKPPMEGEGRWQFFSDPLGRDDDDAIDAVADGERTAVLQRFDELWSASLEIFAERTRGHETRRRATAEDLEALKALGYTE